MLGKVMKFLIIGVCWIFITFPYCAQVQDCSPSGKKLYTAASWGTVTQELLDQYIINSQSPEECVQDLVYAMHAAIKEGNQDSCILIAEMFTRIPLAEQYNLCRLCVCFGQQEILNYFINKRQIGRSSKELSRLSQEAVSAKNSQLLMCCLHNGLTYLTESEVIDAAFNALKWAVWHTQVNCIEELINWLQERAYSPRQGTLSMYLERAQEDLYSTPLHRLLFWRHRALQETARLVQQFEDNQKVLDISQAA